LRIRLADKTNEIKHLNETFTKSQDEIVLTRRQLEEFEEAARSRETILENDLKGLLVAFEKSQDQFLNARTDYEKTINQLADNIREKETLINRINPSAFHVQSTSSSLLHSSLWPNSQSGNLKQSNLLKDVSYYSNINANLLLKDPKNEFEVNKQTINNHLIAEEQRKIREMLQNSIFEKVSLLEKSKNQTRDNLNNLKSKLHDIEAMTGNNLYLIKNT